MTASPFHLSLVPKTGPSSPGVSRYQKAWKVRHWWWGVDCENVDISWNLRKHLLLINWLTDGKLLFYKPWVWKSRFAMHREHASALTTPDSQLVYMFSWLFKHQLQALAWKCTPYTHFVYLHSDIIHTCTKLNGPVEIPIFVKAQENFQVVRENNVLTNPSAPTLPRPVTRKAASTSHHSLVNLFLVHINPDENYTHKINKLPGEHHTIEYYSILTDVSYNLRGLCQTYWHSTTENTIR